MNILIIKQTSLGDVLHATPHIRAIKQHYPKAHLTVLTAKDSAEIYANNPHIDRLVLFDYARFKQIGLGSPRARLDLLKQTQSLVNQRVYELAFDLQGLLRSVIFLYFAQANEKYVKGRWLGLGGFRNKQLHAIDEMTQVLAEADIPVPDSAMEFFLPVDIAQQLKSTLAGQGVDDLLEFGGQEKFVVISPFTRWQSKNWPLANFVKTARQLSRQQRVLITGTAADQTAIEQALRSSGSAHQNIVNLAGKLNLTELAQLMKYAAVIVSGDSFPMHLATAVGAPLVALFGPTDERKTGPRAKNSLVLRPQDCQRCDNPNCARACLKQISITTVVNAAKQCMAKERLGVS